MYHMNIAFLPQYNHFTQEREGKTLRKSPCQARWFGSLVLTWRTGHRGKMVRAHEGMALGKVTLRSLTLIP